MDVVPDEPVGRRGGVGDEAGHLLPGQLRSAPGKGPGLRVAPVARQAGEINGPGRRRGGVPVFKRPILKPRSFRQAARLGGGELPGPARGDSAVPDMNEAVQKGAGGDEHRPGFIGQSQGLHHAHHPAILHQQPLHHGFPQIDAGLVFQQGFHGQAIGLLIALDAGAPDRRPPGEVKGAKLDARLIRQQAHHPAQGVDLLHHVALGQAPHRGIARHLGYGVQVEIEEQYLQTHAGRGQRALRSPRGRRRSQ